MYISQVEIDLLNRQKIKDLTHLGAYHNWVESCFPEEFTREERTRKLWRIDHLGDRQVLLLVSQKKPDLNLLERYGVPQSGRIKEYTPFLSLIKEGEKANFRIVLNPVISVKEELGSSKRGRVMPHITVEHQMKYLLDRAEKNGFYLNEEDFRIVRRDFPTYYGNKGRAIRISRVTYEGILTVSNLELFYRTMTEGFGRQKALGFGMLTIIPIRG